MLNVGKEMVQPPANVYLDYKGIRTLNASLNAQSIPSAQITGHVFKINAKTPVLGFVVEMLSARSRTTIQTVGAIQGTPEIHSEHAI